MRAHFGVSGVTRAPESEEERRVAGVMTEIGKLIDERLQGEYGGLVVFLKVGGPHGDPPHEFFIQSPMSEALVVWTLQHAYEQAKLNLSS